MAEAFYLYVFKVISYRPGLKSKIGVSKSPEKRACAMLSSFGVSADVFMLWRMDRASAFKAEAFVKASLSPFMGREMFKETPEVLAKFVDDYMRSINV